MGPLSCSLVPASHTAPFRQSLNFYSALVESGADATRVVLISGSPPAPCPLPFATHQAEQGKRRSTYSEQMESSSVSPASASAAPRLPLRVPCPDHRAAVREEQVLGEVSLPDVSSVAFKTSRSLLPSLHPRRCGSCSALALSRNDEHPSLLSWPHAEPAGRKHPKRSCTTLHRSGQLF